MQLATPRVPAMAVSTAMITLSNLPQSNAKSNDFIDYTIIKFILKKLIKSDGEPLPPIGVTAPASLFAYAIASELMRLNWMPSASSLLRAGSGRKWTA